jgi:23S rRNA pseudouridine1911/1915/1917 synthase
MKGADMPPFEDIVAEEFERLRLDVYLAEQIDGTSRSFIQKLIKDKRVRVNNSVVTRASRSMTAGDTVAVDLPPPRVTTLEAEAIPLEILYEDDHLIILNKPPGLVVHPAPGHETGTLVNALLHHWPNLELTGDDAARPGIVHRLDRYTSGVMVVAKTRRAYGGLAEQARAHAFDRRYLALVRGEFRESSGRIVAAVGRSLADRKRMAVTGVRGKEAATRFEVLERFGVASLVAAVLETGRTHQVRVHLRFAGHAILGDPTYGVTDFSSMKVPDAVREAFEALEGQALHAELLGIVHPITGASLTRTAPPPPDVQRALEALRAWHEPEESGR